MSSNKIKILKQRHNTDTRARHSEFISRSYTVPKICGAFTLAEVLITLGVIGVVAAVTMPTLMVRAKEKQRVSQLKKSYSVLNQAFLRATEKYGGMLDWGLAITTNTGEKDENDNPIYDHSGNIKALSYLSEFMNAKKGTKDLVFKSYRLNGELENEKSTVSAERYVYLNDNIVLVSGWVARGLGHEDGPVMDLTIVFTDCLKKGCTYGKDIFYFKMLPDKHIIPEGLKDTYSKYYDYDLYATNNFTFEKKCNRTKTSGENGRSCTAWVIYNGNMDYLHCNDLSWDGKHKCK